MKIIDTTTFFEENMIMELRFNILSPFVDKFIICEARYSHSGKEKDIKFSKKDFPQFEDKITHVIDDKEPIDLIKKESNNKQLGFILDIRSNPGGLLSQSIKVSDIFLDRGEIVSTRSRDDKDMQRYRAKKGDLIDNQHLVVLINGGSASASEIVAGALQDHKRAILVGTKSFGKGSVQTIIPFKKSNMNKTTTGIRLTTARYYTPSGKSIQAKGIDPDIIIEQGTFTSQDYQYLSESDLKDSLDNENENEENSTNENEEDRLQKDYQLARAIDLIKGISLYKETLN